MFITFEGIEGSGKSTAIAGVAEALKDKGKDVLVTREPGGCDLGLSLRRLLLDATSSVSARAELFLFLADRAEHVERVIRPALAAGATVLCDRYTDSTIAYQGYARGLLAKELPVLNDIATGGLVPDLTLVLDLSVEQGLARALARNGAQGMEEREGRFEKEKMEFHEAVRNGFHSIAASNPKRVHLIRSDRSREQVIADCLAAIDAYRP